MFCLWKGKDGLKKMVEMGWKGTAQLKFWESNFLHLDLNLDSFNTEDPGEGVHGWVGPTPPPQGKILGGFLGSGLGWHFLRGSRTGLGGRGEEVPPWGP